MKTSWKAILGGAAIVGLVAVPVLAQGPGGGRGRGGGGARGPGDDGPGGFRLERMARALDLSDEQKAQVETLSQRHRSEVEPLLEQSRQLRQDVQAALESGTPDATAIGQKVIAAHQTMEKVRASRDDFEEHFEALLTAEQRQTLTTLKQARERVRGDRKGHRGPRGGFGGPGFDGGGDPPPPPEDDVSPQL